MVSLLLSFDSHSKISHEGDPVIKSFLITTLSFSCLSWSLSFNMDNALKIARDSAVQAPIKQNAASVKVIPKKISYLALFNHSQKFSFKEQNLSEKETVKREFLSSLISALTNTQQGSKDWFEYVNQTENDDLLKQIIKAQLKQSDLNTLFKEYVETAMPEIQMRLPSKTASEQATINEAFDDGKRVLKAFISVQNRIEQIETNMWEINMLANVDLRKEYAGKNFQCFYSLYTKTNLENYKSQIIQEHHRFINEQELFLREMKKNNFKVDDDLALIKDFRTRFLDQNKSELELIKSNDIAQKEINALLKGSWSQRMIVARCLQVKAVKKYKETLLDHFRLTKQSESLPQGEIDVLLNSKLLETIR